MLVKIGFFILLVFVFNLLELSQQQEREEYEEDKERECYNANKTKRSLNNKMMKLNKAKNNEEQVEHTTTNIMREKEDRKQFMREVKFSIKDHDFEAADADLIKMNNAPLKIKLISAEMCDERKNNFDLLHMYAIKTNRTEFSYEILLQLYRQMNKQEHDLNKICDIYKTFKVRVINAKRIDDGFNPLDHYAMIEHANLLLETGFGPKIIHDAVAKLREILLNHKIYSISHIHEIFDMLFDTNPILLHKIICEVINQTYKKLRFRDLLEIMWSYNSTSYRVTTLSCMFWNLHRNMENNGQATMIIAYHFKMLEDQPDFSDLSETKFNQTRECIIELPRIIQNLYFTQTIRFKNVLTERYLTVYSKSDNDGNHIVRLRQEQQNDYDATLWSVTVHDENVFEIQSIKYGNECLYIDNSIVATLNEKNHNALDKVQEKKIQWRIVLEHNFVKIKNLHHGTNLCVNIENDKDEAGCVWSIE